MSNLRLNPGDILVNTNYKKDPWSRVRRWAMGPYSHVFLYMGRLAIERAGYVSSYGKEVPMLFESNGRGVVLQFISNRYGQEVVVMRPTPQLRIPDILDEAIKLASDPQAYYDYFCIMRFVLPRIICEKLHLPLPLSWHRDKHQICSEAVLEIFLRAGLEILPYDIVPLPGDFATDSRLLKEVWRGKLSEEVI